MMAIVPRGDAMLAHEIIDHYFSFLLETPEVWTKFAGPIWHLEAARALANVGARLCPASMTWELPEADLRGHHLGLTVCVADDKAWGAPVFVAEHVSSPRRIDIQYAAWKLLATRAQRRVLVAFHRAKSDVRDHKAVEAAVREVAVANPGKNTPNDIILITADATARPTSAAELRAAHDHHIVGVLE
jgi:hypothetical protein